MNIGKNLKKVLETIPDSVKLIAVSKFHTTEEIMVAYDAGQRRFGENRVQEMVEKESTLPKDIEWHLIGHLQRNKVKYIAPFVSMIESVDSPRLLKEIQKQANNVDRVISILLQVHIAREESKYGFSPDAVIEFLENYTASDYPNIRINGLMGMATFTDDSEQIRREFSLLRDLFNVIKDRYFSSDSSFSELSMGMSSDRILAIEQGSTMVRVGTDIFGPRVYR